MMLRAHLLALLILLTGCSSSMRSTTVDPDILQVREEHRLLSLYSTNPLPRMQTLEQRQIQTPRGMLTLQCYAPGGTNLPVILLLPSIDFQTGDIVTHDRIARTLAIDTPAVVILPNLPQNPEATLRTAAETASATMEWMTTRTGRLGGAANCLTIVGEGASALHALNLAAMQRDRGDVSIRGLILVTPALHPYGIPEERMLGNLPETYILPTAQGPDSDTATALANVLDEAGTAVTMRPQLTNEPLRIAWALADHDIYETVLEVARLVRKIAADCAEDQPSETF